MYLEIRADTASGRAKPDLCEYGRPGLSFAVQTFSLTLAWAPELQQPPNHLSSAPRGIGYILLHAI